VDRLEAGDVGQVVAAEDRGDEVSAGEQPARRRALRHRHGWADLVDEVPRRDGEAGGARRLDNAGDNLVAGAVGVRRKPVVDGEHGALVLEDDAVEVRESLSGEGGDTLDHVDVAFRLRFRERAAVRRQDLEAVGTDVGGALDGDHPAAVVEGASGDEGDAPEAHDQGAQKRLEARGNHGVRRVTDDGGDRPVDVTEQGRGARRAAHGRETGLHGILAREDRRHLVQGAPWCRSAAAASPVAGARRQGRAYPTGPGKCQRASTDRRGRWAAAPRMPGCQAEAAPCR